MRSNLWWILPAAMLLTACAGSPSRPSDPVPAPIPVPCQADLPHEPEPCSVRDNTRQEWLREADGMLRERFFKASDTDAFDTVGADQAWDDGLQDEDVLLAPAPFDALYPHYLCAMTDAALGETDRYAGEQAQYNGILAELAAWLRRTYPPRACTRWQW